VGQYTACSSEGVARSELERAWQGMEHGTATEGAVRGMEARRWMREPRGARWDAWRGGRQQPSSERTRSRARWASTGVRDILPFEREMGRRKEASMLGHARPENIIRMDGRSVLSIIASLKKMTGHR
jgi:hypothetical protein